MGYRPIISKLTASGVTDYHRIGNSEHSCNISIIHIDFMILCTIIHTVYIILFSLLHIVYINGLYYIIIVHCDLCQKRLKCVCMYVIQWIVNKIIIYNEAYINMHAKSLFVVLFSVK